MVATALRASMHFLGRHHHLTAIVAVIGGNTMTPPQLARDTPVLNILHPVEVGLVKPLGNKLHFPVSDHLHSRFCQRLHLHEPLLTNPRLHGGATAVACAYIVAVILNLHQSALGLQVLDNGLTSLVAIHTGVLGIIIHDLGVRGQNIDDL